MSASKSFPLMSYFVAAIGTLVEYYDYALYGFTAAALSFHFFPQTDPAVALIQTYGVFATGSMAKPLGSLIFGHFGDRLGRRFCLRVSMLGIAIPTTVVGLLPSYAEWGWTAPLLLILCRIFQGIFVVGESDGVRIFILETIPAARACFANSLAWVTSTSGIYIGSLACALASGESMPEWAWRVPFLIGGALGLLTLWLRHYIPESAEFTAYQKNRHPEERTPPLQKMLKTHWQPFLMTIAICGASGAIYHFYFVFWSTYLHKILGLMSASIASWSTSLSLLIFTLTAPLAGIVGDRYGILPTMQWSAYAVLLMVGINAGALMLGIMPLWIMLLTAVALTFLQIPGYVFLKEQFQVNVRYRGLSLGHAVGSMALSGTTPLIATGIWQITGLSFAPLAYFAALIFLIQGAIWCARTSSLAKKTSTSATNTAKLTQS